MDKINKLSQAIRVGSTFASQSTGYQYEYAWNEELKQYTRIRSCVLGAARDALGGVFPHDRFPYLEEIEFRCPACWSFKKHSVIQLAAHLNDHHKWTRECIADWLEKKGL